MVSQHVDKSSSHSQSSHPYKHLLHKWVKKHRKLQKDVWSKHGHHLSAIHASHKQMMAGSVAGLMLLSQPVSATLVSQALPTQDIPVQESPMQQKGRMIHELSQVLPDVVQPLTTEQETGVSTVLAKYFNMKVSPSLDGIRLNRCYGLIGAEQHLMRYPGDTMASHFSNPGDSDKYYSSGMAPGRGAWGYFAHSQAGMSEQDVQREKYYIAVPTFLSPTWHDNVNKHYSFFKYRKMLVVNPENGKAIVADIGDAGPAQSTGKHLGGSPEVMKHLERVDGRAKGPVIYLFIDDPSDSIPLGPIDLQS